MGRKATGFDPAVVADILDAMPATTAEIASKTGLHKSTIKRYMIDLYPEQTHICGHQPADYKPMRIYARGPGEDVPYVLAHKTAEYKVRRKQYMIELRQRKQSQNPVKVDPDYEKTLRALRVKAKKNVAQALSKQNTPFGPLFDLGEKE